MVIELQPAKSHTFAIEAKGMSMEGFEVVLAILLRALMTLFLRALVRLVPNMPTRGPVDA